MSLVSQLDSVLLVSTRPDRRRWLLESLGAFFFLENSYLNFFSTAIWKAKVPPKLLVLVWVIIFFF